MSKSNHDTAKKGRLSKKEKIIIGAMIALIVCAVLAAGVVFLLNFRFFEEKTESGETQEIITESMQTPKEINEKVATFLILGIADDDTREATTLTDTILVATVDMENKTASLLQIPRDTYVGNETPTGKINAIYKQSPDKWDYAGLKGLSQMIHEMFQINIDHYVTIKMDGLEDLVDAIGGVTMDVPVDMELNGTYVKAGTQTLNGKQAVAVCRTRNVYANADLGRLNTQKIFLTAFMEKCLSLDFVTMTKLIPTVLGMVTTDLTASDLLGYASIADDFDMENVEFFMVPGSGGMVNRQSVYLVDRQEMADILNENFRPYSDPVQAEELKIKTASGSSGSSSSSNRGGSSSSQSTSSQVSSSQPSSSAATPETPPASSSQPTESGPETSVSQPESSQPETSVPDPTVPTVPGGSDTSQPPISVPGTDQGTGSGNGGTGTIPTLPTP